MNIKLLGILTAGMLVVACGDSTGTGGSGGGGGAEGGAGGGTGGTPVEGGGGSTGNMGGGGGTAATCEEQFPDGAVMAATIVIQECGCAVGSPCETECTGDDACTTPGPETSIDACGTCIQEQADMTATCATAVLGGECAADPDCSDSVTCVLSE